MFLSVVFQNLGIHERFLAIYTFPFCILINEMCSYKSFIFECLETKFTCILFLFFVTLPVNFHFDCRFCSEMTLCTIGLLSHHLHSWALMGCGFSPQGSHPLKKSILWKSFTKGARGSTRFHTFNFLRLTGPFYV